MSLKKLFLFIIIIKTGSLFPQFKGSYQFPEKFNKNYFFNPEMAYQKIKDYQVSGVAKEDMDFYKIKNIIYDTI